MVLDGYNGFECNAGAHCRVAVGGECKRLRVPLVLRVDG